MHPRAITKAKSRLRVATSALEALAEASDFETFTDAWYTFLVAAKNVYTVLEQGSKASSQSRQWFGAKKQERKQDELLQYVFEARNDDEHGLDPIAEHHPGSTMIGVSKPGFSTDMTLSMVRGKITQLKANDGKPVLVEHVDPHVRLIQVRGRGRDYPPPTRHLGKQIEGDRPYPVAEAALAYLEGLVREAEKLA